LYIVTSEINRSLDNFRWRGD